MTAETVAFVRPASDKSRQYSSAAYGHVQVFFGFLENGQARSWSYRPYGDDERSDLAELQISNQLSSDYEPAHGSGSYGWSIEYRSVYSIDRKRAELMAKTLRTVWRGMEREYQAHGPALSFGQFVARALKALKVRDVIPLRDAEWPNSEDVAHRVVRRTCDIVHAVDVRTSEIRDELAKLA